MSYFFHCVNFAKEDGQGLTGGHLSLLFQASKGGGGWAGHKKRCPPLSFYEGAKAAQSFCRVSGLIFLVLSSALLQAAWKFCKDRGAKKKMYSWGCCLFSFTSYKYMSLFLLTNTFITIHFQVAILFIFFAPIQGKKLLCQDNSPYR